jgi:hypothetical protein
MASLPSPHFRVRPFGRFLVLRPSGNTVLVGAVEREAVLISSGSPPYLSSFVPADATLPERLPT